MTKIVSGVIRAIRPHQWVKNVFVLAPLFFARKLFELNEVGHAISAFVAFSFAASAVYLFNDIQDVAADRAHPTKRNRPIASGQVPLKLANVLAATLALSALGIASTVNHFVALSIGAYLTLNFFYTRWLKRVAYIDVLCIALGFELRVLSGTFAVDAPPTVYLLIVTFLLSSFLGYGKRLHELQLGGKKSRAVLHYYSRKILLGLLSFFAASTLGVYVAYTIDGATREIFGTDYLVASAPFTAFGLYRFISLVRSEDNHESPTDQMLRDAPFLVNIFLWMILVTVLVYFGGSF